MRFGLGPVWIESRGDLDHVVIVIDPSRRPFQTSIPPLSIEMAVFRTVDHDLRFGNELAEGRPKGFIILVH
jgi:hypothetical protein